MLKKFIFEIKCLKCNKVYFTNSKKKETIPIRCKFCKSIRIVPLRILEINNLNLKKGGLI